MKQLGSEEARRTFRDLLDDAQRGEPTEISRNGKPVAVLVPAEWHATVIAYISATTFTKEAVDFYARQKAPLRDASEAGTANRAITVSLQGARQEEGERR